MVVCLDVAGVSDAGNLEMMFLRYTAAKISIME